MALTQINAWVDLAFKGIEVCSSSLFSRSTVQDWVGPMDSASDELFLAGQVPRVAQNIPW